MIPRKQRSPRTHRVDHTAGSALKAEVWSYDTKREREFYVEVKTLDGRYAIVSFKVRR